MQRVISDDLVEHHVQSPSHHRTDGVVNGIHMRRRKPHLISSQKPFVMSLPVIHEHCNGENSARARNIHDFSNTNDRWNSGSRSNKKDILLIQKAQMNHHSSSDSLTSSLDSSNVDSGASRKSDQAPTFPTHDNDYNQELETIVDLCTPHIIKSSVCPEDTKYNF
jgi:hypothetical protein